MDRTEPHSPGAPPPDQPAPSSAAPTEVPVASTVSHQDSPPDHHAAPITTQPAVALAQKDHSSVRLLLLIGVVFVCTFLFIRVYALEPFGVPTGSMAPALIGNHREAPCPRCGFPVCVGLPAGSGDPANHFSRVGCPNCGSRLSLAECRDLNGDRLLVDKRVFDLRSPRRWEMAVFRCPDCDPRELGEPYVKRIVGIPGETITIRDGEVFADGSLLRKGLPEIQETHILIHDMSYVPNKIGWNNRWLLDPPGRDPRLPLQNAMPAEPAPTSVIQNGQITLDGLQEPHRNAAITYRNWDLDSDREEPIRSWCSYNGLPRSFHQLPPVHDFFVSCELEILASSSEATFVVGLTDGADTVQAEFTVGPRESGRILLTHPMIGSLGSTSGIGLEVGRKHKLQFSFIDRRVILMLDGSVVIPPATLPVAEHRAEVSRPLQFQSRGCNLVIRTLKLYRDIYYTQYGENGTQPPHGSPAILGPDEYFMLGDNSSSSQDSRSWRRKNRVGKEEPGPGVPERLLLGKPLLIHQPLRSGRVTIGGRERVFQTVDWSRLRWLH